MKMLSRALGEKRFKVCLSRRASFFILLFILGADFSAVVTAEDLQASDKARINKEAKLLYKQAVIDYKHDRLHESQKAFKKILELDESHKNAVYFLEHKIPRKLVEREAKKQEGLRVEQVKAFYLEKKNAKQAARKAGRKDIATPCKRKGHVDNARSLFVNDEYDEN